MRKEKKRKLQSSIKVCWINRTCLLSHRAACSSCAVFLSASRRYISLFRAFLQDCLSQRICSICSFLFLSVLPFLHHDINLGFGITGWRWKKALFSMISGAIEIEKGGGGEKREREERTRKTMRKYFLLVLFWGVFLSLWFLSHLVCCVFSQAG